MLIHSVVSDSLWPVDCNPPGSSVWDSPSKITRVDCHFLLWGSSRPRDKTRNSLPHPDLGMSWCPTSSGLHRSHRTAGEMLAAHILSSGPCCQSTSPQCPQHCRETPPVPHSHGADTLGRWAYVESLNGWLCCFPRWAERCVNTWDGTVKNTSITFASLYEPCFPQGCSFKVATHLPNSPAGCFEVTVSSSEYLSQCFLLEFTVSCGNVYKFFCSFPLPICWTSQIA